MGSSLEAEVRAVLARYPSTVAPTSAPEPLGGAGGLSGSRLWRYRSSGGPMVLRLWPPHGPGRARLERVHRWLGKAGVLGFLPVPIPDRSGQTLQESPMGLWELTRWMPGEPEGSRPPAPQRVGSAFAAMAMFHRQFDDERRSGTSPGLANRITEMEALLRVGLDLLEVAIDRSLTSPDDEARPIALRWLALARRVAPGLLGPVREAAGRTVPLQPCLRDARGEHFLFEGDRVTGLVDFGAMGIDCVAGDLARLIGDWLDDDPSARAEPLTAYERVRPLDPDEAAAIPAFTTSTALLIGERWIRWHYVEGRRFDDPSAVVTGLMRSVERLGRMI